MSKMLKVLPKEPEFGKHYATFTKRKKVLRGPWRVRDRNAGAVPRGRQGSQASRGHWPLEAQAARVFGEGQQQQL